MRIVLFVVIFMMFGIDIQARLNPFKTYKSNSNSDKIINSISSNDDGMVRKYKLSSFVHINSTQHTMHIFTNYKLKRHFKMAKRRKLVFDFVGSKRFYTRSKRLRNSKFSIVKIGAHPKQHYFRVVVKTKHNVSKYRVNTARNGNIVITYKNY